jgi:hypothetical protein
VQGYVQSFPDSENAEEAVGHPIWDPHCCEDEAAKAAVGHLPIDARSQRASN